MGETKKKKDTDWFPTKHSGVRYRKHPTRKNGVRFDRYFALHYKLGGKVHDAGLGWESEGMSEAKAVLELAQYKQNSKDGKGPTTQKQKKEIIKTEKKEKEIKAITFGDLFEKHYLPHSQKQVTKDNKSGRAQKTHDNEKRLYEKWIEPTLGNIPLLNVAPNHLDTIMSNLKEKGRSARTVQYVLGIVRHTFNYARKQQYYPKPQNPEPNFDKPKVSNQRKRWLSHTEADTLLDALKNRSQQVHDMSLLSLHTGMRAGEVFALRWGKVDLPNRIIHIVDTKTAKDRTAEMTDRVYSMLKSMERGKPDDLVFKDENGNQIKEVSKTFDRTVKDLGFNEGVTDNRDKVVFHTLRHTFASWLVMNGTNLYIVKDLMGHSTLAMTERYSHLGKGSRKKAMDALNDTLKKAGGSSEEEPAAEKIEELKLQLEKLGLSADQVVQILTSKTDDQPTVEAKTA